MTAQFVPPSQLVTLAQAAKAIGKRPNYFRVRVDRFKGHATLPPPQPVARIGNVNAYDLQALLLWDTRRIKADEARRAEWATKSETKDAG